MLKLVANSDKLKEIGQIPDEEESPMTPPESLF